MNTIKKPFIEQIMSHREPRHERNHFCVIWRSIIFKIYISAHEKEIEQ
jgi:hypothetical protein